MLIRKPLKYMTDDAGSGDGAGEGGSGDGAAAPAAGGASGDASDVGKTFTQADLDRILAGRLAKFADYDEIKTKLGEVQQANQTEAERAINDAKAEGRREAAKDVAREAFNGLAGRRNAEYDTAPALELIDLGKFVKDDGSVDRDALSKAVEQIVPAKDERKPAPSFGGGASKTSTQPDPGPGLPRLRGAYAQSSK